MITMKKPNIIKETSRGLQSMSLEDELLTNRKIFLSDAISAETADSVIKQLLYLEQTRSDSEITLYINSPGGEVSSGLAIYDVMRLMKTPIRTVCVGTAASMGAILFLAGDERYMLPSSRIMIHDPSHGNVSMQGLKPDELQEHVNNLTECQKKLCDIMAERTGRTVEEIKEYTKKDSFFNLQDAIDFGLAHGQLESLNPERSVK